MHAPLPRATVVITDALGGRVAELVELVKVLGQGGVGQVAGGRSAQGAQLVVGRLHTRMEECRVKVLSESRSKDW